MMKLFTFKDKSYIPLKNPLSRRYDVDNSKPTPTPVKKKKVLRYSEWSQRDKTGKAMEDAYKNTSEYGYVKPRNK